MEYLFFLIRVRFLVADAKVPNIHRKKLNEVMIKYE